MEALASLAWADPNQSPSPNFTAAGLPAQYRAGRRGVPCHPILFEL